MAREVYLAVAEASAAGEACGSLLALVGEVVAVPEVLVELAGQLGGAGAEGGPSAFEEEDGDQAALRRIGVGGEPAEAGSVVGAGSGLAEDGQFVEVGAQAAGGAVLDRAGHAVLRCRGRSGRCPGCA